MRVVTTETKVGMFSEWDADTQQTIIDKHNDILVDHEWWDMDNLLYPSRDWLKGNLTEEQILEFSNDNGHILFTYDNIYFDVGRGSYVQFKGLDAQSDNAFRLLLGVSEDVWEYIFYSFCEGYGRNSNTTIDIVLLGGINCWEDEFPGKPTPDFQAIADTAKDRFDDLIQECIVYLRTSYESLTSDKEIREYLLDSDLEFDAEGNIQ